MSADPWEQLWFTTTWIMNNFSTIEDYHHFEILREREREYQADLEFYGDKEYDEDLYFNFDYNTQYNYNEDDYQASKYSESSSESDYDDYEYI